MAGRVWAVKLGSGGRCIPFCEKHSIVGIGWRAVPSSVVSSGSRDELFSALEHITYYVGLESKFGQWVGSLHRFGAECSKDDFVLYYDPRKKHVQIKRIISDSSFYRDFDLKAEDTDGDEVDIWHCRTVETVCAPIPIVDFHGSLKGKLLGPRGTFWQLHEQFELVKQIADGIAHGLAFARDSEIQDAKRNLEKLVTARTEALNEHDWELMAADYFRSQGASVDEHSIGGNQSVIDFEAVFDHGEIPESVWRVQVKRYQDRPVDWQEIKKYADRAGTAELCFVSVFGFTEAARKFGEDNSILLMQAESFSTFILTGNIRESLRLKLVLPN